MPGPGRKAKSKSKSCKSNITTDPSSSSASGRAHNDPDLFYLSQIDDVEEWRTLIDTLCQFLSLPDLNSRSGLKKIFANFDAIYDRMDALFQKSHDHIRVRGAIVGIFAKMSVDSLLRNKLFEKGILEKVIPLLQEDETRHLALRVLNTVTHHGGAKVRMEVAKYSNIVAKLIDDLPDDDVVAELGVSILAHGVVSVAEGDDHPANPRILKTIDMVEVLKSVLNVVKRFYTKSLHLIEHAIHIFVMTSLHASDAFKAYPSALTFLAAGVRSKHWVCRCACLGGIVRAHQLEAEEDQNHFDPRILVDMYQGSGIPPHLERILMSYEPTECDMYRILLCTTESQKAMIAFAQSRERDLYNLGLKQAALIPKSEHAIADGFFQVEDPPTGNLEKKDFGMPLASWRDSLYHTGKAIREKGKPEEADLADMLEIKYLLGKRALPQVMEVAKEGIKRNPEQAYFYYALSLTADNVQGLRASKRGLKCKTTTTFIKYQLMQRAVDHAGDMGIKILQAMPETGGKQWEEGIAFLISAVEDAKRFLNEAPPDNRYIKNVGYWFVLLNILVNPEISPDLKELNDTFKKLHNSFEFSLLVGAPPSKTNLRLAEEAVVKYYPLGVKQFSHIFAHHDKIKATDTSRTKMDTSKGEKDLVAWLEDMTMEDGNIEEVVDKIISKPRFTMDNEELALYRCSWCGNPSSVLRKCSGCSNSRYCDAACQKSDWKGHKNACGLDTRRANSRYGIFK